MASEDQIRMDFRKWPDTVHWQFDVRPIGEDEHGRWYGVRPDTTARRGDEPATTWRRHAVFVVPAGAWWTANFRHPADGVRAYIDIITPPVWSEGRVTMIDLDLDVIWADDDTVRVIDEDEFEEHQRLLRYPDEIVAAARAACDAAVSAVRSGAEPFGEVWLRRLDRFVAEAVDGAR